MITQDRLKEYLYYNPDSGVFVWIKKTCKKKANYKKVGSVAGGLNSGGYVYIKIKNKAYPAHRLAWLYVNEVYPKSLDHINHIRDDNRIINLREASHSINSKNASRSVNNTSGQTGVKWNKANSRWQAQINVDGTRIHLGMFTVFSEAVDVRKNAEVLYGFHKNHGSSKSWG